MSHEDHAELSPSSSGRWLTCTGSVPLSRGHYSDVESVYAREGTDHHEVAALCLEKEWDTAALVGHPMDSGALLTAEGAQHLQFYLDTVRGYRDTNRGSLCVEEEVKIAFLTGESQGRGKADAVVILPIPEVIVIDLKYGMGVEVDPEDNTQLMLYAAGVIEKHQLWDSIERVRLVIVQPRIAGERVKEWVCDRPALQTFCQLVQTRCLTIADMVGGAQYLGGANKHVPREPPAGSLLPSQQACKFCPANGVCPALFQVVESTTVPTVEGLTNEELSVQLGTMMDLTGLVEIWLHAVRAKVEAELLAGRPVQGRDGLYKLVAGRKGARRWADEQEVEARMSLFMREEEMYTRSLISAPVAEKLLKKTDGWAMLSPLVVQNPATPSVAGPTDKRPALPVGDPLSGMTHEPGETLL